LLERMLAGLPHARALGLSLVDSGPSVAVLHAPFDDRLIGDAATGVIHGGVVTTLLDTCCGVAVLLAPARPITTATLDLRIDYMRPARPRSGVTARAECYRAARQIAFVRAVAWDEDPADPVASAAGAFMIVRPDQTADDAPGSLS
jgi:uncharacterized protein (TIGR00369 family)